MLQQKSQIDSLKAQYENHKEQQKQQETRILSKNDASYKDNLIDHLVNQNTFLSELVEDCFSGFEDVMLEHERQTGELQNTIDSLRQEYKSKEDELRISLERTKLSEHKSERSYERQIERLSERVKELEKASKDFNTDRAYFEKQVREQEQVIADSKKEYEKLSSKLLNVKIYPDIPVNLPYEHPNEPVLLRLTHSVESIMGIVSDYTTKIALVERYNPLIVKPIRYFTHLLQTMLLHGLEGRAAQLMQSNPIKLQSSPSKTNISTENLSSPGARVLWSAIFRPILDIEFRRYEDIQVQKTIRNIDNGKISAMFRDGYKFDTFVCYALNKNQLNSWMHVILSQSRVLSQYSRIALVRKPRERDRLYSLLARISQLTFSLFTMSERLDAEKGKLDAANDMKSVISYET